MTITLPPRTLIGATRSYAEREVNSLREYEPPPSTYKKYILKDGKEIFVGEFPTPPVIENKIGFNGRKARN